MHKCFLLLTLSKLLSIEYVAGNSLMKKSYKNKSDFQELLQNRILHNGHLGMYLGKSYKLACTYLKSDFSRA